MDILTQTLAQEALKELGITNYALYGIPTSEEEFFKFVHPVREKDENEQVIFYRKDEYPFTYEQFIEKYNERRADYDAKEYQRQRAAEYIEVKEQLDQLYHDMSSGLLGVGATTGSWYVGITSVKTTFPKPNVGVATT